MLEDLDPKPMPTPSAAGASGAPPPSASYAATLAGAAKPATPSPTPASTATGDPYPELLAAWTKRNRKLFGALGTAMPGWLATSLYTSKRGDGVGALAYLKLHFDYVAGSGNDRASWYLDAYRGKKPRRDLGVWGLCPQFLIFRDRFGSNPKKKSL